MDIREVDTKNTVADRPLGLSVIEATSPDLRKARGPVFNEATLRDLKSVLHSTVHSHPEKSIKQLAHDLGISPNYLYRSCESGESACRFPLDLLLPLIQATGNLSVLDRLNFRCGRLTINVPVANAIKARNPFLINEVSQHFHALMAAVLAFFDRPDSHQEEVIRQRIHQLMGELATVGAAVETPAQKELF